MIGVVIASVVAADAVAEQQSITAATLAVALAVALAGNGRHRRLPCELCRVRIVVVVVGGNIVVQSLDVWRQTDIRQGGLLGGGGLEAPWFSRQYGMQVY